MSILSKPYFHDEAAAFKHVEAVLWPEGPICHHCGSVAKPYKLEGVRTKASKKNPEGVERHGLYKCQDCHVQFTVRMGTIFEESHIPLFKWLQAIHLMCSSKKGISAHQMHRTLEVTYKTAWFLCHRIREAMKPGGALEPLGGKGKIVEADETFLGQKPGFKTKPGFAHKYKVLSLVERGGAVRSVSLRTVNKPEIMKVLEKNVHPESSLKTDTAAYYKKRDLGFADHETVNHFRGEYVRGEAHTNTLEGFFAIFKRGMKGVYQHCGEQHLNRYLAEFDFRYSNRIALGVNDEARANKALNGIAGKRLMYRDSSETRT
jgi:transposase-like protein